MRSANDFELCVSAVKTSMIEKKEKLDTLMKKWLETDDVVLEEKLDKEIESVHSEYTDLLKSYNEALELL